MAIKKLYNKKTDKRGKKDWRKPYIGKESVKNADWSCRHGGGCMYCELQRLFRGKRQEANTRDQLDEF